MKRLLLITVLAALVAFTSCKKSGSNDSNHPPEATDTNVATDEDAAVGIVLSATDADGDNLSYIVTSSTAHGSLSGDAPSLTYTPEANYNGADSIEFIAFDGADNSSAATISITVNPVQDPPAEVSHSPENASIAAAEHDKIDFTFSAFDPDGDLVSYQWFLDNAFAAKGAEWTLQTRESHGGGSYQVKCIALSAGGNCSYAWTIVVSETNDAPTALAASYYADTNQPAAITLSASDPENDSLSYEIVSGPDNGGLSGTAPDLTYTPDNSFTGFDSFTFRVSDGPLSSNATVTIKVGNTAPTADAGADFTAALGRVTTVDGRGSSDADNDSLSYFWTLQSGPDAPVLADAGAERLRFRPTVAGDYVFALTVWDGYANSSEISVIVTAAAAPTVVVTNEAVLGVPSSGAAVVEGTASDADGDLDAVMVSVDGGPWQNASGLGFWNYNFDAGNTADALTGAIYPRLPYIRVKAVDTEGLESKVTEINAVFANDAVSYVPSWGQFVNDPAFNNAADMLGAPSGGGTFSAAVSGTCTLGAFGGSAVLRFRAGVPNKCPESPACAGDSDQCARDALDFTVYGNAIYSGSSPRSHWSEPAYIMVMKDENGNGLPDDAWYLVPGDHLPGYQEGGEESTIHRTDAGYAPSNKAQYPVAAYFPTYPDSTTFTAFRFDAELESTFTVPSGEYLEIAVGYADHSPTLVRGDLNSDNDASDPGECSNVSAAAFYAAPDNPFLVGVSPGSGGGDAIDISWAVDPETGNPADLDEIHFVKIVNGLSAADGVLGELSAEIDGVVTAVADGGWPQAGRSASADLAASFDAPNDPTALWRTGNVGALSGACVVVSSGKVFAKCADSLRAFDEETGIELWSAPLDSAAAGEAASPAIHQGLILAASGDNLSAFTAGGAFAWQAALPGNSATDLAVSGGAAFLATDNGTLVSIDVNSGTINWTAALHGVPASRPVITPREYVYAAIENSGGGYVSAFSVSSGTLAGTWAEPSGARVTGAAFAYYYFDAAAGNADALVVVATDPFGASKIRALDESDFSILWTADAPDNAGAPAVGGGVIVVAGAGKATCCLLSDGSELWSTNSNDGFGTARGECVILGDSVLVPMTSGSSAVLSSTDGALQYKIETAGTRVSATSRGLYYASSSRIHALAD